MGIKTINLTEKSLVVSKASNIRKFGFLAITYGMMIDNNFLGQIRYFKWMVRARIGFIWV